MKRLLLAAAVALASGCSDPCRDLGDLVCNCNPGGMSEETCKQQVENIIDDVGPTESQEELCSDRLDDCDGGNPDGVGFCEWLDTEEGKVACGLAYPAPAGE
jgi:hypothetical protein